jgi:hypothetical protein
MTTVEQLPRSLAPSAGQLWRAARGPLAVAAAVLVAGIALAAVAGGTRSGLLDPRAVDPAGSRAVAQVLRDQGVQVTLVTRYDQLRALVGPGDTVLVTFPERLAPPQAAAVGAIRADLVVVGAGEPALFSSGVKAVGGGQPGERSPACQLPAAVRAGSADAGNIAYEATAGAGATVNGCYAVGGAPALVQVRTGAHSLTFLGYAGPLTNERFDDLGNASLVLGLLGQHSRLLWYLPTIGDVPAGTEKSFYSLVPAGVWWALGEVTIAALLLMLWRARRLGPVVAEPLPVIVRAAETVEGRARLYRRARARGHAGEALRAGARSRVRPALGLPRGAAPPTVVDAVTVRTGRSPVEVAALLYGAAPGDDASLVRLADQLDILEREIRRP